MIKIRIHGRGGQGNVTLAELIAMAAFYEGNFVQAFPSFGVERKGAPVVAFTKIDNKFIRDREQIYRPDYIIVQDPNLASKINVFHGVKENTAILINSSQLPDKTCIGYSPMIHCVPVLDIALKILGKPIINTAMLGAFAKISNLISISSAQKAIKENLGEKFDQEIISKNIKVMKEAYNLAVK